MKMELDEFTNTTPVITLEVLTESDSKADPLLGKYLGSKPALLLDSSSGVHFLTDIQASSLLSPKVELHQEDENDEMNLSPVKTKTELLEYLIKNDGSVVCKRCGEVLQSRTHWYRHKYKFHVAPATNPSSLFKCEECGVFFKSRKGYIGHIAGRHSENNYTKSDNNQSIDLQATITAIKQEPIDAELAIPTCELPNVNYIEKKKEKSVQSSSVSVIKMDSKKKPKSFDYVIDINDVQNPNWKKQRLEEERLVADIIARVRKECEESGASGGTRKGYSRRSALANI